MQRPRPAHPGDMAHDRREKAEAKARQKIDRPSQRAKGSKACACYLAKTADRRKDRIRDAAREGSKGQALLSAHTGADQRERTATQAGGKE